MATPTTNILLEFANSETRARLGTAVTLDSTALTVKETEAIPDYTQPSAAPSETTSIATWTTDIANKDYYREAISYFQRRLLLKPISFWLKNVGGVGAKDLLLELDITSDNPDLTVASFAKASLAPSRTRSIWNLSQTSDDDKRIELVGDAWRISYEIRALQPQRELVTPVLCVVGSPRSTTSRSTLKFLPTRFPDL